jgi:hypothetical protein
MVTGAAPGLGKSTMARCLGDRLDLNGREVVVFLEAMIAERDEFADVMSSFRSTGIASGAALVEATRRFAATYRGGSPAIVIQDMLLPYLPSLLAWGFLDSEIADLFAQIAAVCSGIQLVQVHLDGSPALSVPRAVEREEPPWLDWEIAKVSRYADATAPVTDLASLVEYFEGARRRTRKLLAEAPWPVIVVDVDHGHDRAIDDAANELNRILSRASAT